MVSAEAQGPVSGGQPSSVSVQVVDDDDLDGDRVHELLIGALLDGHGAEEGGAAFLVLSGGTL